MNILIREAMIGLSGELCSKERGREKGHCDDTRGAWESREDIVIWRKPVLPRGVCRMTGER